MSYYIVGYDEQMNEYFWSARFKRLTLLWMRACYYTKRSTAERRVKHLSMAYPEIDFEIREYAG